MKKTLKESLDKKYVVHKCNHGAAIYVPSILAGKKVKLVLAR
jgi:hypothetical protein